MHIKGKQQCFWNLLFTGKLFLAIFYAYDRWNIFGKATVNKLHHNLSKFFLWHFPRGLINYCKYAAKSTTVYNSWQQSDHYIKSLHLVNFLVFTLENISLFTRLLFSFLMDHVLFFNCLFTTFGKTQVYCFSRLPLQQQLLLLPHRL